MKMLVLGATGMLGHTLLSILSADKELDVFGTIRQDSSRKLFADLPEDCLISDIDVTNEDRLVKVLADIRPNVVINCAGIIKQRAEVHNPLIVLPVNSLLPHRLASLCHMIEARLIHISTDCVFSGAKGNYSESDIPDATDLYGRSKWMGEVDYPHTITLRTSIIGPELAGSHHGLLEWFLGQQGNVRGYKSAIFSGLPTVALSHVIHKYILPNKELSGLYHVASSPINKYDLLCLIAKIYGKDTDIIPDDTLKIDRSLSAKRFQLATGYIAPNWPELIKVMHSFSKMQTG